VGPPAARTGLYALDRNAVNPWSWFCGHQNLGVGRTTADKRLELRCAPCGSRRRRTILCSLKIAEQLERHAWAAVISDNEWRLIWASGEFYKLTLRLGNPDLDRCYGRHFAESHLNGGPVLAVGAKIMGVNPSR
jgi:hypothetical protein